MIPLALLVNNNEEMRKQKLNTATKHSHKQYKSNSYMKEFEDYVCKDTCYS